MTGIPEQEAIFRELVKARSDKNLELVKQLAFQLLSIRADDVDALEQLGGALCDAGEVEEAIPILQAAHSLTPRSGPINMALGVALGSIGDNDGAGFHLKEASYWSPGGPGVMWNLGLWQLQNCQWPEGWKNYRWGRAAKMRRVRTELPEWRGEHMGPGETLLVWGEQGFGDVIMFSQFIRDAKQASGARIVLECQPQLLNLLRDVEGVDSVIATQMDGAISPNIAKHISLLDIPGTLGIDPRGGKYIDIPEDESDQARELLKQIAGEGPYVALAWAGSTAFAGDKARSLHDVSVLEPIVAWLREAGKTPVAFQVGARADDLAPMGVKSIAPHLNDWRGTAAFLKCCDGLITTATGILHLGGAMGVDTVALIDYAGEWRYGPPNQRTCAFHDSVEIARQPALGDWKGAVAELTAKPYRARGLKTRNRS